MTTDTVQDSGSGPLLIVADYYQDAWTYAREHGLGLEWHAWRYVSQLSEVLGRRAGQYVNITRGRVSAARATEHLNLLAHLKAAGFTSYEETK